MKTIAVAFSFLFTVPAIAQMDDGAADLLETILSHERKGLDRWSAGDPLGYLEVFADDVTYFDDIRASQRIDGKGEMKAYVETLVGKVGPHNYEIVDPKVQRYGSVAILTLHYKAELKDGTPLPLWKATSVYHMVDDEWRVVHAHWSLVKEPNQAQ